MLLRARQRIENNRKKNAKKRYCIPLFSYDHNYALFFKRCIIVLYCGLNIIFLEHSILTCNFNSNFIFTLKTLNTLIEYYFMIS